MQRVLGASLNKCSSRRTENVWKKVPETIFPAFCFLSKENAEATFIPQKAASINNFTNRLKKKFSVLQR